MSIEITAAVVEAVQIAARYVCRGHRDLFDQVFSDALQRVWLCYDAARGCSVKTFARRAASWSLADALRFERRQDARDLTLDVITDMTAPSPADILIVDASERAALDAVEALAPTDRDIVVSWFAAEEPLRETAARVGLHLSNVSRRRDRIVAHLRAASGAAA